ncbi:hypothetical protein SAMN04488523_1045 [Sulfitobacter brevis]|uniref:DNA polymerase III, epsilon subunit n=1 Tax=Sulfitobacter brevis TaxID=74348 RepID=A0A1I1WPA7_9RHOB|nr:hypothetical protein [Sulfitobacter brevis]SFD95253.1 hypothetical protein SAMN04488523_1045 [Sulfitobacter brevis]
MFKTPVFIDFEASSLAEDSWPIEVGLAWLDGRKIITHSSLIRPRPDWSPNAWHEDSAKIHKIPLVDLNDAPVTEEVAGWLYKLIAGRPIISDAPSFDERWLRMLAGEQSWCKIHSLDEALTWAFSSQGKIEPGKLGLAYRIMASQDTLHRAGPDAAAHAQLWRKLM